MPVHIHPPTLHDSSEKQNKNRMKSKEKEIKSRETMR